MLPMRIPFTKMHGTGNDFVVINETQKRYGLQTQDYRFLADRHFGVGADQILSVRSCDEPGVDFEYVIHNADGSEVEHCGNGARCFLRFVREEGLSQKSPLVVKVKKGIIELTDTKEGWVSVHMGTPMFSWEQLPFDPQFSKTIQTVEGFEVRRIEWPPHEASSMPLPYFDFSVVSMGNPHAVCVVHELDDLPLQVMGPWLEHHASFPQRVNVGFMQIISRREIKLRVFERGSGETLACGTGACAAVVSGIARGLLDSTVSVHARGGHLQIEWNSTYLDARNGIASDVILTGPAQTVFKGELDIQ
jgi:diaminopimelate epimerase